MRALLAVIVLMAYRIIHKSKGTVWALRWLPLACEGHSGAIICRGYDRRFLSKEAMYWAAEVLDEYGFHPYIIPRSVPTPLVMFTVKPIGTPYGMAITASHNPAFYYGISVCKGNDPGFLESDPPHRYK